MDELKILDTIPKTNTNAWAQFNKITGVFTGIFQDVPIEMLNHEYFNYISIEININTQKVVGTFDNFSIVNIVDEPAPAYEIALDNAAQAKIDKVYSIYDRLDMQEKILKLICDTVGVEDFNFNEMLSYIEEVKKNNLLFKESLMNDPTYTYISRAQQREVMNAQLEGGLHEFIGPRSAEPQILIK
jgi:hypothetical protein